MPIEFGGIRDEFEQILVYANTIAYDMTKMDITKEKASGRKTKAGLLELKRLINKFDKEFDEYRKKENLYT